jgi:protein-tyrosine phosphatase
MGGPGSILVLCHGNICRSPYAGALLLGYLGRPTRSRTVVSAGFILPGRTPPAHARAAAAGNGVDLSTHRSRVISEDMVRGAEVILVMEPAQARRIRSMFPWFEGPVLLLGDFDPGPIDTRTIRDPIDQSRAVFDEVYARIEACCSEFAACEERSGTPRERSPWKSDGSGS